MKIGIWSMHGQYVMAISFYNFVNGNWHSLLISEAIAACQETDNGWNRILVLVFLDDELNRVSVIYLYACTVFRSGTQEIYPWPH